MFEVIGVIDLRHGAAVRARGGRRDQYLPVELVTNDSVPRGDATALARYYVEHCGLERLYVADLDAIEHGTPHTALIRSLATLVPVWLDAGIASVHDARRALDCGVERVIVGLETLPSFHALESISEDIGDERVAFSLDLLNGRPVAVSPDLALQQPEHLAARAVDAGAGAVIVLDLARVGAGAGLDLELLARIRSTARSVRLYAGGGVRDIRDLEQVTRAGCDGALVASALLDGRLTRPVPFAL